MTYRSFPYPFPAGHEIRPQIPARCRLCPRPAEVATGLCAPHSDRALDLVNEDHQEREDGR
jgi:hypothetical protein